MFSSESFIERLAVLSDIHGNIWALEAVLERIDEVGITDIVDLGDSVYGPLDPAATAQLLIERGIPSVRGNECRLIIEGMEGKQQSPTIDHVLSSLTPEHIAWIRSLPFDMTINGILYLCHGSPADDAEYLVRRVNEEGVSIRSEKELSEMLRGVEGKVILCGHDHLQADIRLPNGMLIVDPGSVGLPAYSDEAPYPHAMEAGSPHARFSTIEMKGSDHITIHHRVEYDWEAAAETAERNGREDWAAWLRTGLA